MGSVYREIKELWLAKNLKNLVLEENKRRSKKFWLLDGPPTPNDQAHVGHMRNVVGKDIFLKYYFLKGHRIYFRPGFDVHGLPIEVKVERSLGIKNKRQIFEFGVDKFIEECRKLATSKEEDWIKLYKELGHWYAFCDNPYHTSDKDYIETAWWIFKKAYEKGLVYKKKKAVWWCPRCETTLAGYEVVEEYVDLEDPSVYVLFPLKDEKDTYLLVWTTTPWTLLANVAIAVHPEESYVKAELEDGRKVILAEKRLGILEKFGYKYKILERFKGKELEGKKYLGVIDNKLQKKLDEEAHYVVLSIPMLKERVASKVLVKKEVKFKEKYEHFVNLEEGSGLVHIAPGHGKEDFILGQHYNLPAYSVVDESGRLTEGPFKGLYFRDANEKIIEYLEKRGLLLFKEKIIHRYPACWRCKTPLVTRLTEDYYINIQKIKQKMIESIGEKIYFPDEGSRERMLNWILNEEDWDISRQRFWGIPVPVWRCEKCGYEEVIGSVKELMEKAKLEKEPEDLHRHVVDKITWKCPKCDGTMKRVNEIFDVWYDSGCATFASLHYPFENKELLEKLWRVDQVIEGLDQYRGWFDRLLEISLIIRDDYPYEKIVMTGWVVDEKGIKMSKKLGNVIWALDSVRELGPDIAKWYICWKAAPWETIRYSLSEAKRIGRQMENVIVNLVKYVQTYCKDIKNLDFDFEGLEEEDKWILSELGYFAEKCSEAVEKGYLHIYAREVFDFIVNKVSRTYIKLVRDRIQIENDTLAKKVLIYVLKNFAIVASPIISHLAEYLYQNLPTEKKDSVFLEKYPELSYDKSIIEKGRISLSLVEVINSYRNEKVIAIRYPIVSIVLPEKLKDKVLIKLLRKLVNAENILFEKDKEEYEEIDTKFGKVFVSKKVNYELGFVNELARRIQIERKKHGIEVKKVVECILEILDRKKEFIKKHIGYLEKRTKCKIKIGKVKTGVEFEGIKFKLSL